MKICAIGDPHFKLDWPYGDLIKDGRREERRLVLSAIHEAAKDCGAVVLMGDVFDKKHNHSSVIKDLVNFLEGFGDKLLYVISGNHETYEGSKTALDFLVGMKPRWKIVTPTDSPYFDESNGLGFIPFMSNSSLGTSSKEDAREELMARIEKNSYDVIFLHHMISGTFAEDRVEEFVLPRERLERVAKLVVAGHIHEAKSIGRSLMTGNIFTHNTGDHKKSVWKIDGEKGTYEKIPLPVRPIYKVLNPKVGELDVIPSNAIVKVVLVERGQDVAAVKKAMERFDAHILIENYPDERKRIHVEKGQVLDLSIDALLDLYATAKKKDAKGLHKALALVKAT